MKTNLSVEEKIKKHYEELGLPIIDYSVDGLIYTHAIVYKELIELRKRQSNINCFIIDNREKMRKSVYNKIREIMTQESS